MNAHRPRKRFGQHFLRDPGVIDAIIREIAPAADDTIVEIGPGLGAMTKLLAAQPVDLHAIEIDRDLAARLRDQYASAANVTIHERDALRFDFSTLGDSLRVVGNLPYNISTPLLFHLLEHKACIADMHFMLQKEVVDRMAASPGSKAYGRLTIMLGCHFEIEALFDVDPLAFDPPPAVVSAIVRMIPLPPDTFRIADPELLRQLVAAAFNQRRKTLRNALKKLAADADFDAADIDPSLRAEAIAVADYVALANVVAARRKAGVPDEALR